MKTKLCKPMIAIGLFLIVVPWPKSFCQDSLSQKSQMLDLKLPLFKVLTVDLFAGGNIRLSKYNEEAGFTKYKDWFNIDFSGVSPVAGIAIGILK